jgi:Ca-activated chloride channel family protein
LRDPDVKTTTDAKGVFHVLGLHPGTYTVQIELSGFVAEQTTVTLVSGRTTTIAVRLQVGSMSEIVSVSSQASTTRHRSRELMPAGFNREAYRHLPETGFHRVSAHPRSTFSTDVDTASYTNVRRMLHEGLLPPEGAVRIEEFINYFRFDYAKPDGDAPVAISTEVAPCPWNTDHLLALVGVRATDLPAAKPGLSPGLSPRQYAVYSRNLVFLVDVSGSMSSADKLPLVRASLHLLTDRLTAADRIALVVYAGSSGLVLPTTSGEDKAAIHAAIDRLASGGSTNGGEGIKLAYRIARDQFVAGGVNRVILATDGDFQRRRDQRGSARAADRAGAQERRVPDRAGRRHRQPPGLDDGGAGRQGQRHYAYLDSIDEARKVLVREMDATLVTVAKDVEDPGGVQPAPGRRLPADRLREPPPRRRGLQRRHQGCRRDGGRPHRHRALRGRACRRDACPPRRSIR